MAVRLASLVVLMLTRRECSFTCLFMVLELVVLQPQGHCRFVDLGTGARAIGRRRKKKGRYRFRDTPYIPSVRLGMLSPEGWCGVHVYKFLGFFPLFSVRLSLPSVVHNFSLLTMVRSSSGNHLWKETPATSMTKAQLLGLANAKDMKLKELRRKYSKCLMPTIGL